MREPALAFTAQRSPHPCISAFQLLKLHSKLPWPPWRLIANDNPTRIVTRSDQRESKGLSFLLLKPARARILIANLELEFLASHTKHSLLTFSNRKEIAIFDRVQARQSTNPRSHRRRSFTLMIAVAAEAPSISTFPPAAKTHVSYFPIHKARLTNYESPVTSHETRPAFRSTIPARPHAYR